MVEKKERDSISEFCIESKLFATTFAESPNDSDHLETVRDTGSSTELVVDSVSFDIELLERASI